MTYQELANAILKLPEDLKKQDVTVHSNETRVVREGRYYFAKLEHSLAITGEITTTLAVEIPPKRKN
jgi:hypothetical protein